MPRSNETPEDKKQYFDEPMRVVRRQWRCPKDGCTGFMYGTGQGITTMGTDWQNICSVCHYEEWSKDSYPRIAYLPEEKV